MASNNMGRTTLPSRPRFNGARNNSEQDRS
jgi:hypothetical protein